MDLIDIALIVAVALGAFALWLVGTAMLIWGERRLVAKMQTRVGPNRLGPLGLFQTVADGGKMFFKEDLVPEGADRVVYRAAPLISATVAMLTFAVIPYGGQFEFAGRMVSLQVWDPEIGLLWTLAMSSLGVYGLALAGWASGSKYPLLGGVRSAAQLISYELALGLSVAAVFIFNGTLRSSEIVAAQGGTFLVPFLPAWNVFPMSVAFVIFFVAATAEAQRPPFDLPEAEGELVAGFHTEYSGARFAMFMLAEFMAVITMSAISVTLFFGGPTGPSPFADNTFPDALMGTLWFLLKVLVFVFVFIWLRATLPRLRYDRLMDLGWKVMLPFALAWVFATGFSVVFQQQTDRRTVYQVLSAGAAVAIVLYLVAPVFSRKVAPVNAEGPDDNDDPEAAVPPAGEAIAPQSETTDVDDVEEATRP